MKTWDDASAYCMRRSSYLIQITTDPELEFLNALPRYNKYGQFWIGATDRHIEGMFVYQHSRQLVPERYWRQGEPDNGAGDHHCAYMARFYGEFEVYDGRCKWYFYIACETVPI